MHNEVSHSAVQHSGICLCRSTFDTKGIFLDTEIIFGVFQYHSARKTFQNTEPDTSFLVSIRTCTGAEACLRSDPLKSARGNVNICMLQVTVT